MNIHSIFSSSKGNACLVYTDKTAILLDAGVSWKQIKRKGNINRLDAIFISHAHTDHVLGAGVAGRRSNKPIFLPKETFEKQAELFKKCSINYISGGSEVTIGDLNILAVSTRHDTKNSLAFVISEAKSDKRFGLLTDTGSISRVMEFNFSSCDGYLIEADYDQQLLEDYEEYDPYLKNRISSPWGHLSTDQAVDFIKTLDLDKVKWILLGHISANTNSPDIVLKKMYKAFPGYENKFNVAPTTRVYKL